MHRLELVGRGHLQQGDGEQPGSGRWSVRRPHDSNKSSRLYLLTFVPVVGWIIVHIRAVLPSNPYARQDDDSDDLPTPTNKKAAAFQGGPGFSCPGRSHRPSSSPCPRASDRSYRATPRIRGHHRRSRAET
ncbi:DUF805 domain-containing protein [Arthrobacter sp. MDT1-65]